MLRNLQNFTAQHSTVTQRFDVVITAIWIAKVS